MYADDQVNNAIEEDFSEMDYDYEQMYADLVNEVEVEDNEQADIGEVVFFMYDLFYLCMML
jgi:hypothetical protein